MVESTARCIQAAFLRPFLVGTESDFAQNTNRGTAKKQKNQKKLKKN